MIQFIRLQKGHLETIMKWRLKPEVSQYLMTDIKHSMEDQHRWFNRINKDDTCRYWMICYKDLPIGLINLAAIDKRHLHCSAGYYIGEMEHRQVGAMILPYLYNYVFKEMRFRKIYGEVMAENDRILQIHKMHGYCQVGIYHDHVFKNGRFHDAVLIELLSEIWLKQKRYERYIAEFP